MVTDGPFDMGRFLYLQTRHLGMPFPFSYAANWANLRKCFANFYKSDFYGGSSNNNTSNNKLPGLKSMLDMLGNVYIMFIRVLKHSLNFCLLICSYFAIKTHNLI